MFTFLLEKVGSGFWLYGPWRTEEKNTAPFATKQKSRIETQRSTLTQYYLFWELICTFQRFRPLQTWTEQNISYMLLRFQQSRTEWSKYKLKCGIYW